MSQVHKTGSVRLRGEEIGGLKTYVIARRGLGYVPENRDIFATLSVRQNLLLGMKGRTQKGRWSLEDMYKLFPVLRERADAPAGVMSGGEQQMLTLCRTLMGDPDLVMIDEPTEGLAPKIVELVARLVRRDPQPRRVDPAGRAKAHHRDENLPAPVRDGPRTNRIRRHPG